MPSDNGDQSKSARRRRWPNRWIAAAFLALMAGMAVLAFVLALATQQSRKTRDPKVPENAQTAGSNAPAGLSALRYLPADCNLVAGINLAQLASSPVGKGLLEPHRLALLDMGLALVEKWTGLKLEALDHIVFGVALGGDIPQLVAVIRTRKPYRMKVVAGNFSALPLPHHKKPLFRMKLGPVGGGYLWCADERTLVLLLRPDTVKIEDMDRIPAIPRQPSDALSDPLRNIVEIHLRQADIWLAGDLDRPELLTGLLALHVDAKKKVPSGQLKSFAGGILVEKDLTLFGFLEARNTKSTGEWRALLQDMEIPGLQSRKVVVSPDNAQINWQFRVSLEGLRNLLANVLGVTDNS